MFACGVCEFFLNKFIAIASHGCAACMLCYLVMDGMQCGWYWMIFGLFTVPPIIYDFILIADIVMNRKY